METLFDAFSQAEIRHNTAQAEHDYAQRCVNSYKMLEEHASELVHRVRAQEGDREVSQWQSDYVVARASHGRVMADCESAVRKLDEVRGVLVEARHCFDEAKRRFEEYEPCGRVMELRDDGEPDGPPLSRLGFCDAVIPAGQDRREAPKLESARQDRPQRQPAAQSSSPGLKPMPSQGRVLEVQPAALDRWKRPNSTSRSQPGAQDRQDRPKNKTSREDSRPHKPSPERQLKSTKANSSQQTSGKPWWQQEAPDSDDPPTPHKIDMWFVSVNKAIAKRASLRKFPEPPSWPCTNASCASESRSLQACACNIEHVFQGRDLKKERDKWHPDRWSSCSASVRESFQMKASEIFVVVDEMYSKSCA